jgi:hypothetical protein
MANPVFTLMPFSRPYELHKVKFLEKNPLDEQALQAPIKAIDGIVERHIRQMGFPEDTLPLHLSPEDAGTLREKIKADPKWIEAADHILKGAELKHEIDLPGMRQKITRPWFNESLQYFEYARDFGQVLGVVTSGRHSYFAHFTDQRIPTGQSDIPLSVAGVIRLEGLIHLGLRAGHNYRDTVMCLPAGSITSSMSLYEPFRKEMEEEAGNFHGYKASAVAMVHDPRGNGWQYIVVDVTSDITSGDFMRRWKDAPHKEHSSIITIGDTPLESMSYAMKNMYMADWEDPGNRSQTSERNRGKILPQAAAIVIADQLARYPHVTEQVLATSVLADYHAVDRSF